MAIYIILALIILYLIISPKPKKDEETGIEVSYSDADKAIILRDMERFAAPEHLREKISTSIISKARKYYVDPLLVAAQISRESRYRPDAVGYSDDRGLMQVTPIGYAEAVRLNPGLRGPRDRLFEVDYNLEAGLTLLKHYITMSNGRIREGLARYNSGPTPSLRGYQYADDIMASYFLLRGERGRLTGKEYSAL